MARVVRLWQYGAPSGGGSVMNYRPVAGWGRLPEGWSYVEATSVAVDAADNVYVFNRGAHPVIVFDRDGNFLRSWGEGIFRRPHGITIGPNDTLWLTDDLHHTIRQFTAAGKLLLTIGDPDTPSTLQGGKPFNRPTHVALCPKSGDVYVSDGYGNSRVHKYDPTGRHLHSWGAPGTDPGCFNVPHNLATDADGLVYVADRENHRVQVFDGKGQYLAQLSNLHRPCGLFAERRDGGLLYVGELPTHLAVNAQVPNLGARVSILTLKGDLVGRLGGPFAGEKAGEFVAPHGCAVDSRGALYVAEVSWTAQGRNETPPREIRSLQQFIRVGARARRVVRAHARRRQTLPVRDRARLLRPALRGLAAHAAAPGRGHGGRGDRAARRASVARRRARPQALGRRREGGRQSRPPPQRVGAADPVLVRPMTLLGDAAVVAELERTPDWTRVGKTIDRTYRFQSFKEAMFFVNAVAAFAESAGHHPDIAIHGNAVTLSLWTHSAGGLTAKDFALARKIDAVLA